MLIECYADKELTQRAYVNTRMVTKVDITEKVAIFNVLGEEQPLYIATKSADKSIATLNKLAMRGIK